MLLHPVPPAPTALERQHGESAAPPQPLNDRRTCDLRQYAPRLIEGWVPEARYHHVPCKLRTAELAAVQMRVTDVLRPEPLLLEHVGAPLSQQRFDHLVDVVVPELWVRRLERFT